MIRQRELTAQQLEKDVGDLYDTLKKIDISEFNLKSTYKWKYFSDGYAGRVAIVIKKRHSFRDTLIYDIEDTSCYIKLIESQDRRLFEAIEEVTIWISAKTELIKKNLEDFNVEYKDKKKNIRIIISAYNSLREVI